MFMAQASACALKRTATILNQLFEALKFYEKKNKPNLGGLNLKALFEAQADACAMNSF